MNHRPRIYFRWDENPTQPWTTLKASKNSFRIPGGPRCWNFTMGRLFNSWTSPFQIPVENYCCVSMPVPLLSPTDRPRSFPLSTFLLFHSRLVGNWKIQLTALLYSLHAVSINTIKKPERKLYCFISWRKKKRTFTKILKISKRIDYYLSRKIITYRESRVWKATGVKPKKDSRYELRCKRLGKLMEQNDFQRFIATAARFSWAWHCWLWPW